MQTAVDAVRHPIVDGDGVELRDRQTRDVVPGRASVPRHREPAVIAKDGMIAVAGIEPKRVVIDVQIAVVGGRCVAAATFAWGERLAAVGGAEHRDSEYVDLLVILRVDADLAVVVAGLTADGRGVGLTPGGAGVVAAIDLTTDLLSATSPLRVLGLIVGATLCLLPEREREGIGECFGVGTGPLAAVVRVVGERHCDLG